MEGTWIEPISKPSLKYISSSKFGKPPDKQNENLQNLGKPAVESFNFMLHEGLDKAVADITPLEFSLPSGRKVKLQFDSVELFSPSVPEGAGKVTDQRVYPKECRMRGSTYKGKLVARISWSLDGEKQMPIEKDMGSIPIMVKSDLCNLAKLSPADLVAKGEHAEEWGGYFIIKGHERILRMLTGVRKNYPIAVQRETWKRRGKLFTDLGVLVRCVKEDMTSTNNVLHYLSNGTAKFMCSYKKALYYLPVVMVLKGLLDTTDEYIFEQLTLGMEDDLHYRERVALMLRQLQKEGLHSHQDVQRYIGRSFRLKIKDIPEWYTDEQVCEFLFRKSVAIHLGTNEEKFNLITFMARKLFAFVEDKCVVEGMDPVMMQEVLLGGHLYLQLLKDRLENWLSGLKYVILKKARSSREEFTLSQGEMMWAFSKTSKLETTFETFLATGNLPSTADIGMMQDTGLSIVAENINRMRYMSHFKAVHRGAAFADTRNSDVRQLKPDAWGFLCPVHTPDGSPCGLLNHFTALCEVVNNPADWSGLPSVLVNLGMIPQESSKHSVPFGDCYTVLLEGCVVGRVPVKEAARFVDKLRIRKVRGSQVPKTLEIVFVPKKEPQGQYPGIFLFHAIARMMRPVLNLAANAVEYIGSFEQIYLNICITMEEAYKGITTHQELRETSFLSNLASLIPLPDFNQSPRNMYQCQMGKQTMGTPCHNWGLQTENKLYRIQTPTSPLLRPAHWDRLSMDEFAMGTNAIVAVISYTGYDMEDAMVINRASLQRGFAYGQVYKSEFVDLKEKRKGSLNQTFYFQRDPSVEELKAFIDADGLPYPGTILQEGDPYYSFFVREEGRYFVERYKGKETAFVDNIKLCGSEDGSQGLYKICITLRIPRFPSVGDKFASRAGQKGICSQQWLAEDLPFTESGLVPDIVFNPHGFPSRMTIAMMIESMAGKSAAVHGMVHDATPFQFSETNTAIDYFGKLLEASGYNYYGTEKLYSGVDGREMEADIFFGVVHYQRLRHMVSDKYQVRSTGPVDHITRQPIKGRKRGGGIRFGEMERDALASHGASFLLYDRLVECSDQSVAFLCKTCGSILSPIGSGKSGSSTRNAAPKPKCHVCGNSGKVTEIMIPHVLKYLIAELASVNIKCIIDAKAF